MLLGIITKASKTDPFRKGITLFLSKMASDLCPASTMLVYIIIKRLRSGPFFTIGDGRPLTQHRSSWLQSSNWQAWIRINMLVIVFELGPPDSSCRGAQGLTFGKWKSPAYLEQIRIPKQQLASHIARLGFIVWYLSIHVLSYCNLFPICPCVLICYLFMVFIYRSITRITTSNDSSGIGGWASVDIFLVRRTFIAGCKGGLLRSNVSLPFGLSCTLWSIVIPA